MAVAEPDFFFIGGEPDAVTRVAMAAYVACFPSFHHHLREFFAGVQVANLEAEEAIHSGKNFRLFCIYGKWADEVGEGAHLFCDLIFFGAGHIHPWVADVGQVNGVARRAVKGIVRSFKAIQFFDDVAGFTIHHVPYIFFQRWQVHRFAIGRDGHAIAATLNKFFPYDLVGGEVYALERFERTHINAVQRDGHGDAFYV